MLAADLHLLWFALSPQFVHMTVVASPQSNLGKRLEAAGTAARELALVWRRASPIDFGRGHGFTT